MAARILVVDDEQDMLDLLRYNLQQHGYEVVAACEGAEALRQAQACSPDLVILDLMLAGLDGFTVCEMLRRHPATARTPIIMLTALSGQMVRVNGLGAGANDFVRKPFNLPDLLNRVKQQLERPKGNWHEPTPGPSSSRTTAADLDPGSRAFLEERL